MNSWSYDDRATCQQIVPRVWLGPHGILKNDQLLSKLGITYVFLVRSSGTGRERSLLDPSASPIPSSVIELDDNGVVSCQKPFTFFVIQLREKLEENETNNVVIVGLAGINRSASLLAAFLISQHQLSVEDAMKTLTDRRRCVSVSPSLRRQLVEFSVTCSTRGQFLESIEESRHAKRSIDDLRD